MGQDGKPIPKGERTVNIQKIERTAEGYLRNREITGGILIVRRGSEVLYRQAWGYADAASRKPVSYDHLWRMMSMTKPVTAAAVMQLAERGLIDIDRPVSDWIPAFGSPRVADDDRYRGEDPFRNRDGFTPGDVKTVPASRPMTARDLLTHTSGLEQGPVGQMCGAFRGERRTLADVVEHYAAWPLDFDPGTQTGYSPQAGFDVLLRLAEIVSDMPAGEYLRKNLFDPLEMESACFFPSPEDLARTVALVRRENGDLLDVTEEGEVYGHLALLGSSYTAGGAGLYATAEDYDHFTEMLACEGERKGIRVLKPETVRLMRTEAPYRKFGGGCVWGLGMMIRKDPVLTGSPCPAGSFGWSGAFGTHFVVSPSDGTSFTWVTNRTDLNGSSSYISAKMEELVYGE